MKNLILIFLLLGSITCFGQFHKRPQSVYYLKPIIFEVQTPPSIDLKLQSVDLTKSPQLSDVKYTTSTNLYPVSILNDGYWSTTSNHYSADGQLKATYTYDMLGNIRESRLTFSFKKRN